MAAGHGRPFWHYHGALPADIRPCCGRVNRGLAILGDKVFLGTLDSHAVALDAKTGNIAWDVTAFDYTKGYSITLAPLAVKDLIIVGVSGGRSDQTGVTAVRGAQPAEGGWACCMY